MLFKISGLSDQNLKKKHGLLFIYDSGRNKDIFFKKIVKVKKKKIETKNKKLLNAIYTYINFEYS